MTCHILKVHGEQLAVRGVSRTRQRCHACKAEVGYSAAEHDPTVAHNAFHHWGGSGSKPVYEGGGFNRRPRGCGKDWLLQPCRRHLVGPERQRRFWQTIEQEEGPRAKLLIAELLVAFFSSLSIRIIWYILN